MTGLCNSKNWHSSVEAEVLSSEETKEPVYRFLYGLKSDPDPAELHHLERRIHWTVWGLDSCNPQMISLLRDHMGPSNEVCVDFQP